MIKKHRFRILLLVLFFGILIFAFLSNATLRILFPGKIRAHKVNTVEKMSEASKHFSGLELDVFFHSDGNYFEVNHPPDSSINLSLANYLIANSKDKSCSYWLDFKNLNQYNAQVAAHILDSLLQVCQLNPSHFIVESMLPQFLKTFKEKGFLTSYYLPTELYLKSDSELTEQLKQIKLNLNNYNPTYISFDYRDYSLLKKSFPEQKKISWFTVYGKTNKFTARWILFEMAFDKQLDVLLLPYHAAKGNR